MGMLPLVAARPAAEVMWLDLQPAGPVALMTQAMAMLTTPRLTAPAAVSMARLLAHLGPQPSVRVKARMKSALATLPAGLSAASIAAPMAPALAARGLWQVRSWLMGVTGAE
jgi:hypothetical protein